MLGPGGDSNIKMPGCLCLVHENRLILDDTLSSIFYDNIKFNSVIYVYHQLFFISHQFGPSSPYL